MITVGICDDREGIRIFLECVIADYIMRQGLMFEIKKYKTGLELLNHQDPLDILFLDISMPGLNGIETGRRLRENDRELKIIYITAHEHYALEAFRIKALNYLVKPLDQQKVFDILDDAFKILDVENSRAILKIKYLTFPVHKISYIEARKHQIVVHILQTSDREEQYVIKGTLKEIEPMLEKYRFEKPRRGVWVNPIHVEKREGDKIYMPDGAIVLIAQV